MIRESILDDIMHLLSKNRDVHIQFYAKQQGKKPRLDDPLMEREDFSKLSDTDLVEGYKYVVMRCFRQR